MPRQVRGAWCATHLASRLSIDSQTGLTVCMSMYVCPSFCGQECYLCIGALIRSQEDMPREGSHSPFDLRYMLVGVRCVFYLVCDGAVADRAVMIACLPVHATGGHCGLLCAASGFCHLFAQYMRAHCMVNIVRYIRKMRINARMLSVMRFKTAHCIIMACMRLPIVNNSI